jgi:hypothetical protein
VVLKPVRPANIIARRFGTLSGTVLAIRLENMPLPAITLVRDTGLN